VITPLGVAGGPHVILTEVLDVLLVVWTTTPGAVQKVHSDAYA